MTLEADRNRSRPCLLGRATATRGGSAPCWSSPARAAWPAPPPSAGPPLFDPGPGWSGSPRPAEVQPTVASFEPSYMTYPLPCDENGLIQLRAAQPILERLIEPADVVAVGPGLGQSDDIRQARRVLDHVHRQTAGHRRRRLERPGRPDRPAVRAEPPGHPDPASRRVCPADRRRRSPTSRPTESRGPPHWRRSPSRSSWSSRGPAPW